MKLWDKGLSIDKKIEQFTVGNDRIIDIHIAKYDVTASIAHAKMLADIGILTVEELKAIEEVLNDLLQQINEGTFVIEADFEDVHSKIEHELIVKLGATGKKIHTARSRNDQVLVALHLFYKENTALLITKIEDLFNSLIKLAETHKEKYIPGYTHLQVAMPSSFGLWFAAYAELLIDDVHVLKAAAKVVNQNPLGSAAGYGSSFPIKRGITTELLDFETLKYNVVAAQMSRGKSERVLANALGNLGYTLSKFAMDICLYMSQNFGFITFPDELTTGSSIMPHKKNPDVFELIRAKCNKIQGLQAEIAMITNNLPSGYHRDFQELKAPMLYVFEEMKTILEIFNYAIQQIIVNDVDVTEDKYKYMFTVDAMNGLVQNGATYRDAYKAIGEQVLNGTYQVPKTKQKHTHEGSIGNLCLQEIQQKFKSAKL